MSKPSEQGKKKSRPKGRLFRKINARLATATNRFAGVYSHSAFVG